ncbi:MAG: DNA polymerase/3'-5' exonuclease PolX [Dehalococcoidia bacterium]
MNNSEISKVFADIASLLQAKGDSPFKIRAYQRAADAAANLSYDLSSIADDEEKLGDIPGFGDAIVSKVQELVKTGRLEYFDNLKGEFPPGVLLLMNVHGIGPKMALRAATDLGIETIDDLVASIESGAFGKLPRVGEKTAQNILRHLKVRIGQGERVPIGIALPAAERVMAELTERCPGIRNLTYAGSLRRGRETIGDIDLVCTADTPAEVTAAFVDLPAVRDVIGHGDTKASVVVEGGLQVDLRVVDEQSFAATLLYFTGSQRHSIRLRERAQKMGLSLNEYGLTNVKTDKLEQFPTEEAVYKRLGLAFIPPEMREDSGEVEAAQHDQVPPVIDTAQIRGDLHSHTDWSDGKATLEEMVDTARKLGREYLAITDHSPSATVANGLSVERLVEHNKAVQKLDAGLDDIQLLLGTEMDILPDGSLDYPDDVLSELDVVLGSIHSAMEQDGATMTARIIKAMQNPHLDIIAHLTTRLIMRGRAPVDMDVDAVFEAAVKTGAILEINASPHRLDLKDTHVRRARDMGVIFAISTDAHRPGEFGNMRYGVTTARRGWCEGWRVINALPFEDLKELLSAPKGERYAMMQRRA